MPLPPHAVSLGGHVGGVDHIAFLAKGNRIVTACGDSNALVYDADTGALLLAFAEHHAAIVALAVLEADLVVTADMDEVLCVWRATQRIRQSPKRNFSSPTNRI